ncbi:MAG: protease modulator HflK [Sphingomonas sp.]|uniref:protease modulator HflK n=1 Tax=Sphingomonas sp. TaxID=28214 RepID=UPI0025EE4F31|nr:protease modulator HflK [Sphingomonas sp.]MBX9881410.1 protease modulator HflK [Sphingomonas sp.]
MTTSPAWWRRLPFFMSDKNSPWGGGSGGDDGNRNPWAVPPGGRPRPGGPKPTALDEFLRRARGPQGPGGGGGGFGGLPGGAQARNLWLAGIALVVVLWVMLTSIHVIGPQQRGVVTVLGRYADTLPSGIGLTLPAPFAAVQKIDVESVRTIGFPGNGGSENLVLTGDQNIVDLSYTVSWNVSNPQDYVFEIKDPEETVRAVAEASMRAVMATVTLDQAIAGGKAAIAARTQQLMQSLLNQYHAGIQVQGVDIGRVDPPSKVRDAFKEVSAAQQEAQSNMNNARGYAQQVIARAEGAAREFDLAYEQYRLAPDVTRRRMYYETLEQVLGRADKTVVGTPQGVQPYLPLPVTPRTPPAADEATVTSSARAGGSQ